MLDSWNVLLPVLCADAILDVPSTRAMYLRRLRSLADKYYAQGALKKVGQCSAMIPLATQLSQHVTIWGAAASTKGREKPA